ncbi:MAG: flagellar basal body-associated FliL family protein [bacterium]
MADKQNGGKPEKELGNIDEDEMSAISQIESSKKKGGGIKKLLFILIPAVLLLGGGGFAAYHFLLAKPKSKAPSKPANVSSLKPGPMINLKPFLTNLADKDKTSYIKVSISIELKQGSNPGTFKQLTPQIRNSIIMIMSSKTSREINTPQGILSLRHQIARSLNRILGDGTVTAVYFNNYLVQ